MKFSVRTRTFEGADVHEAMNGMSWDVSASGDGTLDARGKAAVLFAKEHAKKHFHIKFALESNSVQVDGVACELPILREKLRGATRLLIEATSLSCPEILYLLWAATRERILEISFLYAEPQGYRRKVKNSLCERRDFDLGSNRRFQSFLKFTTNLTDLRPGRVVFFLGYEGARPAQALEQEEVLQKWSRYAVFGVPAFQPAWEIDSLANNVQHIAASGYDQIEYAGAASVEAAYRLLNRFAEMSQKSDESPVVVAPLGTKPHTIACALFLIEHAGLDQSALMYDHAERSEGRSQNIRRWHIYDVRDGGG